MITYITLALLAFNGLQAQDAQQDLKKVQDRFLHNSFAAVISQSWYASYTAQEAVKTDQMEIKLKKDQAFYNKAGEVEMLCNDRFALALNHRMQVMLLQPFSPATMENELTDLESQWEDFPDYSYEVLSETTAQYVFTEEGGEIGKIGCRLQYPKF